MPFSIGCSWLSLQTLLAILFILPIKTIQAQSVSKADAPKEKIFTFHVSEEPATLDPRGLDRFTGKYILGNIFRGLVRVDENNKLVPELAHSCTWKNAKTVECKLRQNKWSNGEAIPLLAYKETILQQLKNTSLGSLKEYLVLIEKVPEFWSGTATLDQVGVEIEEPNLLRLKLREERYDFIYTLAHPAFSPLPADKTFKTDNKGREEIARDYATGPYRLLKWRFGRSLLLERNPHFYKTQKTDTKVEVFFVIDDNTALSLFEKGKLSLLRRLPPELPHALKNDPRLKYFPFLRFDYLGFADKLKTRPEVRKALTESLDYKEFQRVFLAKGRPGCASIPASFMHPYTCYEFNKDTKLSTSKTDLELTLYFSQYPGDELLRSMQWVQNQWTKNLGLKIHLQQEEFKLLSHRLKTNPPDIFRRGVPLDRPSCLAGLSIFQSDSPDNFVGFKSKKYDSILKQMAKVNLSDKKRRQLCGEAFQILVASHQIIPLGEIHFPMLDTGEFTGWTINAFNQIDLTHLQ